MQVGRSSIFPLLPPEPQGERARLKSGEYADPHRDFGTTCRDLNLEKKSQQVEDRNERQKQCCYQRSGFHLESSHPLKIRLGRQTLRIIRSRPTRPPVRCEPAANRRVHTVVLQRSGARTDFAQNRNEPMVHGLCPSPDLRMTKVDRVLPRSESGVTNTFRSSPPSLTYSVRDESCEEAANAPATADDKVRIIEFVLTAKKDLVPHGSLADRLVVRVPATGRLFEVHGND